MSHHFGAEVESDSESSAAYVQDSDAAHYIYYYGLNIELVHETANNEQSHLASNESEEGEISQVTYEHSSDLQFQSGEDSFPPETNIANRQSASAQVMPGLSEEAITQIPKMVWKLQNKKMNSDQKCAICLSCYEVNQNLRVLSCLHRFHAECLDEWLRSRGSCPSCRHLVCDSC